MNISSDYSLSDKAAVIHTNKGQPAAEWPFMDN